MVSLQPSSEQPAFACFASLAAACRRLARDWPAFVALAEPALAAFGTWQSFTASQLLSVDSCLISPGNRSLAVTALTTIELPVHRPFKVDYP